MGLLCGAPSVGAQVQWTTHQGNPAKTGYRPTTIDVANLRAAWTVDLGAEATLTQAMVAEGKIALVLGNNELWVLDAMTGAVEWKRSYRGLGNAMEPAIDGGRIYVQTVDRSAESYLRALDLQTGEELFKVHHRAGLDGYLSPTVYGNEIYTNAGRFGGLLSVDAVSGKQQWLNTSIGTSSGWSPAVDKDFVYTYLDARLSVVARNSGLTVFSVPVPSITGFRRERAPVLGGLDDVLVTDTWRLIRFDLKQRKIAYELFDRFSGQPAVFQGTVYAINDDDLEARRQLDGSRIWELDIPNEEVRDRFCVTDGHLIVPTNRSVHLVDLKSRTSVWSSGFWGRCSVGEGALFVAQGGVTGVRARLACFRWAPLASLQRIEPGGRHAMRPMERVTFKGDGYHGPRTPEVRIGGKPATGVQVVDAQTLTCVPPAGVPGLAEVQINNGVGRRTFPRSFAYRPALDLDGDYQLGGMVDLRILADPNSAVFVAIGREAPPRAIPPLLGELALQNIQALSFVPHSWTGIVAFRLAVPRDPGLIGTRTAFQALVGPDPSHATEPPTFSNLGVVEVLR